MVLVSEVADLAVEAGKLSEEIQPDEDPSNNGKDLLANVPKNKPKAALWSSIDFATKKSPNDASESEDEEDVQPTPTPKRISSGSRPQLHRSPSGSFLFKSRLDKWVEPKTKKDKVSRSWKFHLITLTPVSSLLKNFLFLLFCMFRLRDLRFRMFLNSSTH
jgi:hypothetical protein